MVLELHHKAAPNCPARLDKLTELCADGDVLFTMPQRLELRAELRRVLEEASVPILARAINAKGGDTAYRD